jgi:hypothetical protein
VIEKAAYLMSETICFSFAFSIGQSCVSFPQVTDAMIGTFELIICGIEFCEIKNLILFEI